MSSLDVVIHAEIWDLIVDGMLSFDVLPALLMIWGISWLERLFWLLDEVRSKVMMPGRGLLHQQEDCKTGLLF